MARERSATSCSATTRRSGPWCSGRRGPRAVRSATARCAASSPTSRTASRRRCCRLSPAPAGDRRSTSSAPTNCGDALVGYCRFRSHPAARDGAKEIEVTRGRIGLVVTVEGADQPMPAGRPPGARGPTGRRGLKAGPAPPTLSRRSDRRPHLRHKGGDSWSGMAATEGAAGMSLRTQGRDQGARYRHHRRAGRAGDGVRLLDLFSACARSWTTAACWRPAGR